MFLIGPLNPPGARRIALVLGLVLPILAPVLGRLRSRSAVPHLSDPSPVAAAPAAGAFHRYIEPVLRTRCVSCHGEEAPAGGLSLTGRSALLTGGDHGPAVVPGDPENSLLYRRISQAGHERERMPPGEGLPAPVVERFATWIRGGADWPDTRSQVSRSEGRNVGDRSTFRPFDLKTGTRHWAFQPLRRPVVPVVRNEAWVRTPVDRFILAKLEEKGLTPAPRAARRQLIRRLYFDMLGLPPTPEEVEQFLRECEEEDRAARGSGAGGLLASLVGPGVGGGDFEPHANPRAQRASLTRAASHPRERSEQAPRAERVDPTSEASKPHEQQRVSPRAGGAYERLVDRVLASPHYGERWGRFWLDLARYADSSGYEADRDRPAAYPYRDWVIRALNADMPFDRFVRWQIAGDLYAPADPQAAAATGFCTSAPTIEPGGSKKDRLDELDDLVSTTSTAFLGLTVGCARCHDHKFDPISQKDYYGLVSVFAGTRRTVRPLDPAAGASFAQKTAAHRRTMAGARSRFEGWMKAQGLAPGDFRDPVRRRAMTPEQRTNWARFEGAVEAAERQAPRPPAGALSLCGTGGTPTPIYAGGNPERPGTIVTPAVPAFFAGSATATRGSPLAPRQALAEWLVDPDQGAHRLTARVIVNRVWQHHFGQGLVRTPSDFGLQGDAPSHPELLDYLASVFAAPAAVTSSQGGKGAGSKGGGTAPWRVESGGWRDEAAPWRVKSGEWRVGTPVTINGQGGKGAGGRGEGTRVTVAASGAGDSPFLQERGRGRGGSVPTLTPTPTLTLTPSRTPSSSSTTRTSTTSRTRGSGYGLWTTDYAAPATRQPAFASNEGFGWSLKRLHRLILTSAVYMQGTRWDEGQARRDPENRLLWRRAPQRLEAEAIRDAMLAVSGCLNEQRFGPGIRPRIPAEAIFKGEAKYGALWPENVVDGPATWRRSIYIFVKRTQPLPILQTFDAPEAVTACSQRTVSTVAPQALALLNDPFVREQAERLASRVRREAGELPARQVDRLYRLALGRPPRATEQDACLRFLARGGSPAGASLADLCQSMMGLNEFIYVD